MGLERKWLKGAVNPPFLLRWTVGALHDIIFQGVKRDETCNPSGNREAL